MGYTTEFFGHVTVTPPLNADEISFLTDFSETRRMMRRNGPLFVKGSGYAGQGHDNDVIDFNCASGEKPWSTHKQTASDWHEYYEPDGQPGLWCQWVPSEDGTMIKWNGAEKFYNSTKWMRYIIDKLLGPSAREYVNDHIDEDVRLLAFTCDHLIEGTIRAEGEEQGDNWSLVVSNNNVFSDDEW